MKLPEEYTLGIEKWNTEELWRITQTIKEQINPKKYDEIKNGKKTKFHINTYNQGRYTEKNKSGYVIINQQKISLEELWEEIEERERNMRQEIIKNTENKRIIQPNQQV